MEISCRILSNFITICALYLVFAFPLPAQEELPPAIPIPDMSPPLEDKPLTESEAMELIKKYEKDTGTTVSPDAMGLIMMQAVPDPEPGDTPSEQKAANEDFPTITIPEDPAAQDPDLKLFENWIDQEKKSTEAHIDKNIIDEGKNDNDIEEKPVPQMATTTTEAKTIPDEEKSKVNIEPEPSEHVEYKIDIPFTYKSWRLPRTIYRDEYGKSNQHLPKAVYEEYYDAQLFAAAARNDVAVVRAFLESGRDVEISSARGESLLLHAVRYRAVNVVRLLLGRGADANRIAANGGTALHYAVANHDYVMAEALLAGGADPHIPDNMGISPLQMAQQQAQQDSDIIIAMQRALMRRGDSNNI